jgi:hypothetical protein
MKRHYSFVAGAGRDGDDDDLRHRIDPLGNAEQHRLDGFPLVDRICGAVGIVALMLRYLRRRS